MTLELTERLISNIIEYRRLESEVLPPNHTKDSLLEYLCNRSEQNAKIMAENTDIISTSLRSSLKNPIHMTVETADHLLAMSQRLHNANTALDMGLALEVYEGLIEWARLKGDTERLIASLYGAGISADQIVAHTKHSSGMNMHDKALKYFNEAASFRTQYFEIQNKETRMYIHRCLGNAYLTISTSRPYMVDYQQGVNKFIEHLDIALKFWNDEKIRSHDPDFPWDALIFHAHQGMCGWLIHVREQEQETRDMNLAWMVYNSFEFMMQQKPEGVASKFWPHIRNRYTKYATAYCVGKITYDEMLEELRDIVYNADMNDYSYDGVFIMLSIAMRLIEHLGRPESTLNNKSAKREIEEVVSKMAEYCKNISPDADRRIFNRQISVALEYLSTVLDFEEFLDLLLSITTYSHLSTYVHSVMVYNIVKILTNYFTLRKPELFVGMCGTKTTHDVLSHKKEVLNLICRAALCHDAGKAMYVDAVSLCSRRLFDFEFEIIKEHTNAAAFIKIKNEKIELVADAIRGHHKWYDGTKGYREEFDNYSVKHKFVIDMIAVADSIDAATDIVGRSYSKALTLEQVVNEIHEQAGSRYCPTISQALKDPVLLKQIDKCLTEGRKDAYYQAYMHITNMYHTQKGTTASAAF